MRRVTTLPITCLLGNSLCLAVCGRGAFAYRDAVVEHSKFIIIALTLTAWWLRLRQHFSGRLMKVQFKDSRP
jgi:hypothetical protein